MANYATLKAAVQAVVKSNGNKEITGTNMQSTLLGMITSLASGYIFKGVATTSTSPGTPDENVFYIGGPGTYTNFGTSTTVPVGAICVFRYNGSWSNNVISLGSQNIYKASPDSVYYNDSVYINTLYYLNRGSNTGVTITVNDTLNFNLPNDNNQYLVLRDDQCMVIRGADIQAMDVILLWYAKNDGQFKGGELFDDYVSRELDALKIENEYSFIYPSTSRGYFFISGGAVTTSTSNLYERCKVNVTDWQGKDIYINVYLTSAAVIALTNENGDVLKSYSNTTLPATGKIPIPSDAAYLYLSNRVQSNPDLFIKVPVDKNIPVNGNSLLNVNYLNPVNHYIHSVYNGTVTEGKGLLVSSDTTGLRYNRCIQLDNWSLCARIETVNNTETAVLGTVITQTASVNHATRMEVDFALETLKIYNNSTDTLAVQTSLTNIDGYIYMLKLERINRAIKATLYNEKTGEAVSVTSNDGTGSSAGVNAAGKMFDCPIFYLESGSVYLKNISATSLVRPKVLFVGDSITQGAHTDYDKTWSVMAGEYYGNSLTGGRGSGDVWCCLNQVRSIVPILKPKAVVVTIGTNNTYNQMTEDGYLGLYKSIVNIIKSVGAIPIVNNIVACDSRNNAVTQANNVITKLNEIGCRFDLATSINNNWASGQNTAYYYTDNVHLNDDGNELLYNIIINELGYLKDI